jgi:hypothetical protein
VIQYYKLGAEKRLNEIVMAGSHDAGITQGGRNAKTQKRDILGQALAGVRLFDLRVAGSGTMIFGNNRLELRTYHGPRANKKVSKVVAGLELKQKVLQSKVAGTWGEGLLEILTDAKSFVTTHDTEFLILKFDKCTNWEPIAALCLQELDTVLYTEAGNVNKKTLHDLKGKVVVVFTEKGLAEIDHGFRGTGGILGIKSLNDGSAYQKDYDGIQYYGKGGTDLTTRESKSIEENIGKQLKLMRGGAAGNPNVMGMMYWTTTGVVGSIRERDRMMWQPRHVNEMQRLWAGGMGDAVKARLPECVDPASFVGGPVLKRFLPNFVMVDFAGTRKCQTIFDLNASIPTELTRMEQLMIALRNFV